MNAIICKGISGKSISINIDDTITELADWFIKFHEIDMPNIDIYECAKATKVEYLNRKVNLKEHVANFFDKSKTFIKLNIFLKSWTMGRNFDFSSFTAICPITLEICNNPYDSLCCHYIFEKNILLTQKKCPMCNSIKFI